MSEEKYRKVYIMYYFSTYRFGQFNEIGEVFECENDAIEACKIINSKNTNIEAYYIPRVLISKLNED